MSKTSVSINIPKVLYETINRIVETHQNEFRTVEEYIVFVLQEVTKEEEPTLSANEEDEIKKRLQDLGYL
ncbi:MAG: hypothetical protein JSV20_10495 [Candidatus Bathyarchaeota archaeon]|jgi:16S rRNA C1402 (ribose-2'-O) methylase RsmI|nr:MAG: hypothetical protein JSV20_10495 [Candidatus Bathyarchaeota archaeon]